MLSTSIEARAQLQQTVNPHLIIVGALLELSNAELEAMIREELERNPALEAEPAQERPEDSGTTPQPRSPLGESRSQTFLFGLEPLPNPPLNQTNSIPSAGSLPAPPSTTIFVGNSAPPPPQASTVPVSTSSKTSTATDTSNATSRKQLRRSKRRLRASEKPSRFCRSLTLRALPPAICRNASCCSFATSTLTSARLTVSPT